MLFCGGLRPVLRSVVFLLLAPTSSIISIFWEAKSELRPYLPMSGLLALLVVGCYRGLVVFGSKRGWSPQNREMPLEILLGLVVIALGSTTVARTHDDQDLAGLWQIEVAGVAEGRAFARHRPIKVRYHHAEAYIKMRRVSAERAQWTGTVANYERGLQIYPQSFKPYK